MALYVAKNGEEFEIVVKGRNDPRFQFLNEYHVLFPYYSLKRQMFLKELGKEAVPEGSNREEEVSQKEEESGQGAGARSVCFSIKPKSKEPEQGAPGGKPKLFEYDSSEGEEGRHQEPQLQSESISRSSTPPVKPQGSEEVVKQMEEKLKDKLASALKERISQSSKERNLQAERKKKAAMFLTLLKSNQPSASSASPPPATLASTVEDSATLYVGESQSTIVYEYDNQHKPLRVKRSKSPRERHHRRRKSPTPPSAYSMDRRSPGRPSPVPWQSRGGSGWSQSSRDKDSSRSSWGREAVCRSPTRREDKKKKHKRSKSRTPPRRERSKERSKHSKEKSAKHKSKDKDRDKERERDIYEKKKSRHGKSSSSRSEELYVPSSKKGNAHVLVNDSGSDVEVVEHLSSTVMSSSSHHASSNGDWDHGTGGSGAEERLHSSTIKDLPPLPLPSSNGATQSKTDSLYRNVLVGDCVLSPGNSNSASSVGNGTKDGTANTNSAEQSSSNTSSDFMTKVRAMLKKSREMILKEDGFALEDT